MRRRKWFLSIVLCGAVILSAILIPTAVSAAGINAGMTASAEYNAVVSQAGNYYLSVTYINDTDDINGASRSVSVDGIFAENMVFLQRWEYTGQPGKKANGDEIRAPQRQIGDAMTCLLYGLSGGAVRPMEFSLKAGSHRVDFLYVYGAVSIQKVEFVRVEGLPKYSDYSGEYQNRGCSAADQTVHIEGEDVLYRSRPSIRIESCSDPAASPAAEGKVRFNTVGGGRWNSANQRLTFEFDCPQSGLYQMSLRVYQKFTDGLPVFRQLLVDGKVPFAEMESIRFSYADWKTVTLSDADGKPYEFYFEKGRHTLELRVVTENYAGILAQLTEALELLSSNVQRIIKITGVDPDVNFDYELEKKIPGLTDELSAMNAIIEEQCNALERLSEKAPVAINSLRQIVYQTKLMLKDPYQIPSNISFLTDSQTTISTWIKDFNSLPLQIDFIELSPPGSEVIQRKSTVWQIIRQSVRTFLASFTDDYASVADGASEDTLRVWISRGKEWGEILQELAAEDFTGKTGIGVDMNILPAGQLGTSGVLLLAIASGTQPDLTLGTDMLIPTEYGMRGAVTDLAKFPDYAGVANRFVPGTMRAYSFGGAVYALPETVDMTVMYYRSDILKNLDIDPAQLKTWDSLCDNVLPVLKQNGMDFWYEGGLNTFLYQNGGDFYSADGKRSALDSPEAFRAFRSYTELYRVYEVPVAANFYTRFRSGQMPLGISSLSTYLLLQTASPELYSKWDVTVIPSTVRADGSASHACSGTTTGAMILSGGKERQAWEFLKWYTSYETQKRYSDELLASMGDAALWFSANEDALDKLQWNESMRAVVQETSKEYIDSCNVVGGYITARHIENARVRSVVSGMNDREALEISVRDINLELERKQKEFDRLMKRKGEEN